MLDFLLAIDARYSPSFAIHQPLHNQRFFGDDCTGEQQSQTQQIARGDKDIIAGVSKFVTRVSHSVEYRAD